MSRVNMVRAFFGGLVAGLLLNIGEFLLNQVMLGDESGRSWLARHRQG